MPPTRHRIRISAAVLASCFALGGCAMQSSRPVAAGNPGSQATSAPVGRHARTITIDTTPAGANVPDDVEHYPLAVLLDRSRFDFGQARADGADIRFFGAGGKALPHAIEHWDRKAGSAAIWVLLDVIKGNSRDQSIEMRWGNPGAPDVSDSKAVFRRAHGFVGVWHLAEEGNTEPAGYKDASDHEAHGTGVGMMPGSRVDARIGKGTHLHNPAGQDAARWVRVTGEKAREFNPGPPITVSIWALGYSYPIRSYETIIAKGDTSWTLQRVQYGPGGGAQKIAGQGYQTCVRTPAYHLCAYNFAGQGLVTKEWLHFMVVFEEPGMKLYINGELNASESAGPWNKGDHDLGIGNQTQHLGGRRQWDGILDEARVMQVARGRSWARLDYESQRQTPTLLEFGEVRTMK
jgi:biopolymer transport protein ExbB